MGDKDDVGEITLSHGDESDGVCPGLPRCRAPRGGAFELVDRGKFC
jgi:hypothetical protein